MHAGDAGDPEAGDIMGLDVRRGEPGLDEGLAGREPEQSNHMSSTKTISDGFAVMLVSVD